MPAVAEPRRGRPAQPARRSAPVKRRPASRPAPAPKKKGPARTAETLARRRAARPAAPVSTRGLPGWGDLDGTAAPRAPRRRRAFIDGLPTLRLAAWVLIASVGLTLYVGHVYATRATLESLESARRDNLRLHLTAERLRATFDAMTGPSQILPRAAALGLQEGIAYGPPIHLRGD